MLLMFLLSQWFQSQTLGTQELISSDSELTRMLLLRAHMLHLVVKWSQHGVLIQTIQLTAVSYVKFLLMLIQNLRFG